MTDSSPKNKKNLLDGLLNLVKKFFKVIRGILTVISEALQEGLQTFVFLTAIVLKFISSPSTPCLVSISVFGLVVMITTAQWWSLGVWLGELFGLAKIGSFSAGACGMFLGLALNSFQLSSEMWKISRQFAEFYSKKSVDTNLNTPQDMSVKARLQNWLSYDHKNLKGARNVSYILETGLMITFTLLGNLNLYGLVLGAISLLAPEIALKFVSSTVSLLGGVNDDDDSQPHKYNL